MNNGIFNPYRNDKNLSRLENLKLCQKLKEEFTIDKMSAGRAKILRPLFELIFKLDFKEDPDYDLMYAALKEGMQKVISK
jgi:hypothetical protein